MRRSIAGLLGFGFVAALAPALPAPARAGDTKAAEARAEFFRGGAVPSLVIELGKKEADSLRREPRTYVKGTLKEAGKTYADVGMHLRGSAGSFRNFDDKPGLTLNMDKFVDGQAFHGLDKFHLANSAQDPSYLSELICGELFRASGVPAARIGHAVVTLNGRRLGMYYLKEGYDKEFLTAHFKNHRGNLYDGGFLSDVDRPLQLLSGKGDVADRGDLKRLVAAANEPDKAARFRKMSEVLDMDEFISFLAMDTIIWDWDGYPMKMNNYRVYHDPVRDKIVFIPSGMDQMFADTNAPIMADFQGVVARRLIETPEGRKRYLARVAELMKTVFKPDDLVKRLDELEARIRPVVAAQDAGAGRDYKNHVDRLRQAIRQRAKSVEAQLKQLMKS